jgi:hypothetical protein
MIETKATEDVPKSLTMESIEYPPIRCVDDHIAQLNDIGYHAIIGWINEMLSASLSHSSDYHFGIHHPSSIIHRLAAL